MATKFLETILTQISIIVQAGLAAKLDEIDSEKNDGITLEDVASDNIFITEQGHISEFPAIEIFAQSQVGSDFMSNSVEFNPTIQVRVWSTDNDNDEENVSKRIYRYQRALTEVIKADDDLNGNVDLCIFVGHSYEDMTETDYGAILYGASILFEINNEEPIQ